MLANLLALIFAGTWITSIRLRHFPYRPPPSRRDFFAPVAVLSICQIILLASIGIMLHIRRSTDPALVILLAQPVNAMLIAVENLIFLIFPVARSRSAPAISRALAGKCWSSCSKSVSCSWLRSIAGGIGAGVWFVPAAKTTPVLFLATTVYRADRRIHRDDPAAGVAFRKFDPSTDTPA